MTKFTHTRSLHNAVRYWNYSSDPEDELPWADWILKEAGLLAIVNNDERLGYMYEVVNPQLYTMFNLRYSEPRISKEALNIRYTASFG